MTDEQPHCPLIDAKCREDCILRIKEIKDSDLPVERLAKHYKYCYLVYYIIITTRKG